MNGLEKSNISTNTIFDLMAYNVHYCTCSELTQDNATVQD